MNICSPSSTICFPPKKSNAALLALSCCCVCIPANVSIRRTNNKHEFQIVTPVLPVTVPLLDCVFDDEAAPPCKIVRFSLFFVDCK